MTGPIKSSRHITTNLDTILMPQTLNQLSLGRGCSSHLTYFLFFWPFKWLFSLCWYYNIINATCRISGNSNTNHWSLFAMHVYLPTMWFILSFHHITLSPALPQPSKQEISKWGNISKRVQAQESTTWNKVWTPGPGSAATSGEHKATPGKHNNA